MGRKARRNFASKSAPFASLEPPTKKPDHKRSKFAIFDVRKFWPLLLSRVISTFLFSHVKIIPLSFLILYCSTIFTCCYFFLFFQLWCASCSLGVLYIKRGGFNHFQTWRPSRPLYLEILCSITSLDINYLYCKWQRALWLVFEI